MVNLKTGLVALLSGLFALGMPVAYGQQTEGSATDEAFRQYGQPFEGVIAPRYEDAQEWWKDESHPAEGAPNVLIIMLDDLGYGQLGSFGGIVDTPNLDLLAERGLRFNNFHVTPICSSTRASLIGGRNHHRVGMGAHAIMSMGFPGYNGKAAESVKGFPKHLKHAGYVNYMIGKWDHTPFHEVTEVGPFDRWPSGEGFDRFYGFMAPDSDNFRPALWQEHTPIEDWQGKEDYHLTDALADRAIHHFTSHASVAKERPFMMYWAPVSMHTPHQAPQEYIDRYKGKFDMGWDEARTRIHKRQVELGIIPAGTALSPRPEDIPAWESLTSDERKLYSRQMEAFAAMLAHTDDAVGRMIDALQVVDQLDNTVIIVTSDNGASAEGGLAGSHNETYLSNGLFTPFDVNMKHYEGWGGPNVYGHYHAGWAMAGNTPFKYFKQMSHAGGVQVPLIIHWPEGIKARGEIRSQFHHISDIAATVLDITGIEFQSSLDGVEQLPFDGVSMAYSFDNAGAAPARTDQYFEMLGNRAVYKDGWKAVALHAGRMPWTLKGAGDPDDDVWELYHVAEDFSESIDLSRQYPEKLEELQQHFDKLAWENNVYPIQGDPLPRMVAQQARIHGDQKTFTYYAPGAFRIGDKASPPIKAQSHTIRTTLDIKGGEEGVILANGGAPSGFVLFVKNGRLHYEYNAYSDYFYKMSSPVLETGINDIEFRFEKTGEREGIAALHVNGVKVAETHVENLIVQTYSLNEYFDIGRDTGTPVSKSYGDRGGFEYTGALNRVEITLD